MAFRTYELNLIMRVQDRATTRLRKLSSDLGGMNRVAQLQREGARIAAAQQSNLTRTAQLRTDLESRTSAMGARNLATTSQLLNMKAREVGYARQLEQQGIKQFGLTKANGLWARNNAGQFMNLTSKQQAMLFRNLSLEQQMVRLRTMESAEVAALNAELAIAAREEQVLAANAARTAEAMALAQKAQSRQMVARGAIHAGGVGLMFGAVGLGIAGAAAGSFASFNREVVKTATQLRGVNAPMSDTVKVAGALGNEILRMTKSFPASASEMAQAGYEIASGMDLGSKAAMKTANTLDETKVRFNQTSLLLRDANRISVAGFTDTASAADTLVTILNNFDPAAINSANATKIINKDLNTLFAIVRFGRGDFTQFSVLFGGVAAAAKGAGQSLVEAGSALAFLTTRLPRPQAAAGYQRLIQILNIPTFRAGFKDIFQASETQFVRGAERLKPLSEILAIIHTRANQAWAALKAGAKATPDLTFLASLRQGGVNLNNLIQEVTKRGQLVLTGREGQGTQGTIQARRALTNLILGIKQYRDILKNVIGDTHEFDRSFAAANASPGVRWQIAINQFKAFAIVLGQSVLPVMVHLLSYLGDAAHKFEELSPHTRTLIGHFFAWAAVGLTVGGMLSILAGSIARLIEFAPRLRALVGLLGGLKGLGVITISMALMMQGGNWSTLGKLIMAAFYGYRIGGPVGAIVIPIILSITDKGFNKDLEKLSEKIPGVKPLAHLLGQGGPLGSAGLGAGTLADLTARETDQAFQKSMQKVQAHASTAMLNIMVGIQNGNRKLTKAWTLNPFATFLTQMDHVTKTNTKTTQSIYKDWQNLAENLTGLDVYGSLNQQAAVAASNAALALAKAQASGDVAGIRAAAQAEIKMDQANEARLKKMPTTAARRAQLIALYQHEAQMKAILAAQDTKQTTQTDKATAAQDRLANATTRLQNAEIRLQQIRQQNLDQLRSAFGQLFGGAVAQGPIASIFTGLNQTLQSFGATGVNVPASITLQDQRQQQKNFNRLNADLAWLRRHHASAAAIKDILSQGSAALPFLEGIRHGTAAQQKEFFANLRKETTSLNKAANSPWDKQLMAANLQLKAALLNLKAAQGKLTRAQQHELDVLSGTHSAVNTKAKPPKATSANPPSHSRTLAGVVTHNTNHNYTVHADGATTHAVSRAIAEGNFRRRTKTPT